MAAVFLCHELHTPAPMISFHLFRAYSFSASIMASFLIMAPYNGLLTILPFFFENIWNFSPEQTGYLVVAAAAGFMAASFLSGRSVDVFGCRRPLLIATCFALSGACLFILPGMEVLTPAARIGLFLFGAGSGGFNPPNISLVMKFADAGSEGVVSGILTAMRFLG